MQLDGYIVHEDMMITRKGYVWIVAMDHNTMAETRYVFFNQFVSINYYSMSEGKTACLHKIEL